MLEMHLRSKVQPLFEIVAKWLIARNVTADMVTLASLAFGLCSAVVLGHGVAELALPLLWLSGICDVLDGTIARQTKSSYQVGAYFDLIADRVVEAGMIVGFFYFAPDSALAYILFLSLSLLHLSAFVIAGSLFKSKNPKSLQYEKSFIERAEVFTIFSLMMIFPSHLSYMLSIFNVLVAIAAVRRFFQVLSYAQEVDSKK